MIHERSFGSRLFDVANYAVLGALGLACLFPLIHILAVSLSDRAATTANLVTLWPVNVTTLNYERIIADGQFQRSFVTSVVRVVVGTAINMLVVVFTAYPLSLRNPFPGRTFVKWFLLFAMLFQGGLIPLFLVVRNLHMLDTLWALVLPTAVQVFYVIVMVNFFRELPSDLLDAATVDGASHWRILFSIYLPLSLPALATLTLFCAVDHWNAWFDGLVFIQSPQNYPLQTHLQTTVVAQDFTSLLTDPRTTAKLSERSMRAAQIFLATVPILLLYPFLQRYFVKGLTLGSVKG